MLMNRPFVAAQLALPGRNARREGGFTLFELIIVIILVAWLAATFFTRVLIYQEAAEKAAMEQTAGAIRSGLVIQLAGLITRGSMDDLPKLAAMNPIQVLATKPANYVGEFYQPAPGDIPRGSWYYDLKYKHLVYLVARDTYFVPDEYGNKWVRFRVKMVTNPLFSRIVDGVEKPDYGGLTLEEVKPYAWVIK